MLSVKGLNTEYKTQKGPAVRAAQDVAFEAPKGEQSLSLAAFRAAFTAYIHQALGLLETLKLEHEDLLYVGDALFPGGNDYSMVEANFDTVQVSGPDETLKYVTDWNENGIEE